MKRLGTERSTEVKQFGTERSTEVKPLQNDKNYNTEKIIISSEWDNWTNMLQARMQKQTDVF